MYVDPCINFATAEENFEVGKARGPDHSTFCTVAPNIWMGFHRLAINGLTNESNQPLHIDGCYLVCNGEIYNFRELYNQFGITPYTQSDCEVILHMYLRFGLAQTLDLIDASEFAFVLYDSRTQQVHAARDAHGVRPLYYARLENMTVYASELKCLQIPGATHSVFPPGSAQTYPGPCVPYCGFPGRAPVRDARGAVQHALYEAVLKRVLNTDRPIACLLSGGLDSSIVAALVQRCRVELGHMAPLETYSIGMAGSEDLKHAAIMAAHLGSQHTSIVLSEEQFFNAIPEVVRAIESYDTTTVRASVGNYLVAKYIREHSEAKVIFNGDGADELAGGYLYFHYAPDVAARDAECKRLLKHIYCFDALRSDKCIASNGLEARTPFLDRAFVQTYLAIPMEERFPENTQEKFLLRQAFQQYLPEIILRRRKEAFSDGVSGDRPWFQAIQSILNTDLQLTYEFATYVTTINPPKTLEQFYYRRIFDSCYEGANTIPYFWMPRFVESDDCSARTLSIYKN